MSSVLLVDATSVFAFQKYLIDHEYEVKGNIDYGALLYSLRHSPAESPIVPSPARVRPPSNLDSRLPRLGTRTVPHSNPGTRSAPSSATMSFEPMIAFVAVNPEHEGQQKFVAFLRSNGFTVDETDFRDAYVVPNKEHQHQRLSTRLTYVAGMLTSPCNEAGVKRTIPRLVVVTDAFDVYYPLLDYVENRGGKVTIAFFRRGMEDRWQRVGLFDDYSPINFCDLSSHAKAILGVDLASSLGSSKEGGKGLADFKL